MRCKIDSSANLSSVFCVFLGFMLFNAGLFGCANSKEEIMNSELFYKIEGAGNPPIVMLHGMLGSHRYWDGVVPKLSVKHELILIDLFGFGESPKPEKLDYSVDQHISRIEDVLKKSQKDKLRSIIVGHSMGTFLALNYAIAHPEQVEKLILINAPMKTDEESLKKAIAESSSKLMVTMTFSKTWGKLVCKIHEIIPSFSYPMIRIFEPDLPPAVARAAGQHTYDAYVGSFENILLNQNFYELLAKVSDIPVLIIASNQDEHTTEQALDRLPKRNTIKLVRIDGNHNVLLKDPDRISEEILKFVN